jgi:hypothetical protein
VIRVKHPSTSAKTGPRPAVPIWFALELLLLGIERSDLALDLLLHLVLRGKNSGLQYQLNFSNLEIKNSHPTIRNDFGTRD